MTYCRQGLSFPFRLYDSCFPFPQTFPSTHPALSPLSFHLPSNLHHSFASTFHLIPTTLSSPHDSFISPLLFHLPTNVHLIPSSFTFIPSFTFSLPFHLRFHLPSTLHLIPSSNLTRTHHLSIFYFTVMN